MKILVTGGAGFIGSALCRYLIGATDHRVVCLDKLTYAADRRSLSEIESNHRFRFIQGDIGDRPAVAELLAEQGIDGVINLAAESHVDRSIDGAGEFIQTNIVGTFNLLEACRYYWERLPTDDKVTFRFHHVSTDEVFGDLPLNAELFTEFTGYDPSSPYSASKAASDHLVRAWFRTYGLPIVLSNCSNNYGPYHFPEKLIPLMITNALEGKSLPVYGTGANVRDWLYVEDHARALELVFTKGKAGRSYNIGGRNERSNLEVVKAVCLILDELRPRLDGSYQDLISFEKDRPGHDLRYGIDATRIETELGWHARESFDSGIARTVRWYLDNEWWWRPIKGRRYLGERLGLTGSG